ncbi:MAG: cysteine rich repeat-containing protein [Gallionella sp.]
MKNVIVFFRVQMKWFSMLAGMFCLILATGASAATRPCADDAVRLCNGIKPGGGAVAKCLKEHSSELSPACKKSITKAKRKARVFNKACREDAGKFCQDEKRGGGRIMKCLATHQDELTPACKEMMTKPIGRQ